MIKNSSSHDGWGVKGKGGGLGVKGKVGDEFHRMYAVMKLH